MNIVGLHFGHDASVAVLRGGRIVANVYRERMVGRKHAMALDRASLEEALRRADLKPKDIDWVAITCTQHMDIILTALDGVDIHHDVGDGLPFPSPLAHSGLQPETATNYLDMMANPIRRAVSHPVDQTLFAEFTDRDRSDMRGLAMPKTFMDVKLWPKLRRLAEIADAELEPPLDHEWRAYGFHWPLAVTIDGRRVPGVLVHHHLGHAASSFYRSGFTEAAVLTQDGDHGTTPLNCGGFFWGSDNRLVPLAPHHMPLGAFYEEVGQLLRLSALGAPGKLMGLAPYGTPRWFNQLQIGNTADLSAGGQHHHTGWIVERLKSMIDAGYGLGSLGRADDILAAANVDLAASCQLLFEENRLAAVSALHALSLRNGLQTENLCLSGGVALNCPANARIWREGPYDQVFVEPNCDDGGLAVGVALYLCHHLLGELRRSTNASPYWGESVNERDVPGRIALHAQRRGAEIQYDRPADAAESVGAELAAGAVIGWVEGAGEVGPRALGHRSILADPRDPDMWARVNRIKGRETWRPFAPAVIAEKAADWFGGCPLPSPYMLFTGQVLKPGIPAVTHVDGSARLQTVTPENGGLYSVLKAFERHTGVPMLMNTSLNGPGTPIADSVEQALDVLIERPLDALYVEGWRVVLDRKGVNP